tara:strand:+ start:534 stop:803 length:270 start_codon:yes stop_codon:yes gene_type:complete
MVNGERIELNTEETAYFNQRSSNALSEFDMAMEDLRAKRNNLLAETDHLALSDQTLSDDMKTYRQELRDITNGLTTKDEVDAVTFPTKP